MRKHMLLKAVAIAAVSLFIADCRLFRDPKGGKARDEEARMIGLLGLATAVAKEPGEMPEPEPEEDNCFNCHDDAGALGQKILSAQASYEKSVHANGTLVPIMSGFYLTTADDSILTNTYATTAYQGVPVGWEFEGSNAFYANGGGCQTCHTHDGFIKSITGQYADLAAADADYIQNPSPIGCFTCHAPHTNGDFSLRVPNGTAVTTPAGGVYDKDGGNICASCHVARLTEGATNPAESILISAQDTSRSSVSTRTGPHHSPTTDVLLGTGGAQYTTRVYSNSAHSSIASSTCTQCHMTMPSDDRASFSPGIAGHSFNGGGSVHGTDKQNIYGCVSCHGEYDSTSNPTGMRLRNVVDSSSGGAGDLETIGQLWIGDAYMYRYDKTQDGQLAARVGAALNVLADPSAATACDGMLSTFAAAMTTPRTLSWSKDFLGNVSGRCVLSSWSPSIATNAGYTDTSQEVRFLKAVWNYRLVQEDKSFGVHNPTYVLQILWDTCSDLNGADCTIPKPVSVGGNYAAADFGR